MTWWVVVAAVTMVTVSAGPEPSPAALNNYGMQPQQQNLVITMPSPNPILDQASTKALLEKLADNHKNASHQSVPDVFHLQPLVASRLLQQQEIQQGIQPLGMQQGLQNVLQPQQELQDLQMQQYSQMTSSSSQARPNPLTPPEGLYCPPCTGPDCCEMCVERNYGAPEAISLLELAMNPFFYVQYVEDCAQAQYLDNVCFIFIPLLDISSLFTLGQIVTFQDGTVEQRQFHVSCNEDYKFTALGSGCSFTYEIIYADELCGVYVFQRCFEHHCCQLDSGPIQIVSTTLPAAWQCLNDALEFVQKLYPCKVMVELPQESPSLCSVLGNTLVPDI